MKLQILLTASTFLSSLALIFPKIVVAEKLLSINSSTPQLQESQIDSVKAYSERAKSYYEQGKKVFSHN